jgi:hypothetical protein
MWHLKVFMVCIMVVLVQSAPQKLLDENGHCRCMYARHERLAAKHSSYGTRMGIPWLVVVSAVGISFIVWLLLVGLVMSWSHPSLSASFLVQAAAMIHCFLLFSFHSTAI